MPKLEQRFDYVKIGLPPQNAFASGGNDPAQWQVVGK
jgi:hypothetical protein